MTGWRGSHRGGNAGGCVARRVQLGPEALGLPTGRDCYELLRLHGGVSPTAGALPRGSTIFRLPRTQQQMPDFRVLTRKIDCINCSDTFNRRRL